MKLSLVAVFLGTVSALGCKASAVSVPAEPAPMEASLVLRDVTVIAMDRGAHAVASQTVVIAGATIVWVGPAASAPVTSGGQVVDGSGQFLIPGLSDMHAHLPDGQGPFEMATYLRRQLDAGVTSVRSMRGADSHRDIRDAISSGKMVGPDLVLSSKPLSAKSLSADEAAAFASSAKESGAQFIKLMGVGDDESFANLMAAAAASGLDVAGHLPQAVSADAAARAGMRSIEHLGGVLSALKSSRQEARAAAKAIATSGTFHCPTLYWYAVQSGVYLPEALKTLAEIAAIDDATRARWDQALKKYRASSSSQSAAARELSLIADRLEALLLLHQAGAKIVVGPDAAGAYGVPGAAIHEEMALMTAAGMPAAAVLTAATVNAAELRGALATEGSIGVGKVANLVLLERNPLEDIGNTRSVAGVAHRGRWRQRAGVSP